LDKGIARARWNIKPEVKETPGGCRRRTRLWTG
jgi:hypothetical protein